MGHEFCHSPTSSAEIKHMWSYTFTLIYVYGMVLNQVQDMS